MPLHMCFTVGPKFKDPEVSRFFPALMVWSGVDQVQAQTSKKVRDPVVFETSVDEASRQTPKQHRQKRSNPHAANVEHVAETIAKPFQEVFIFVARTNKVMLYKFGALSTSVKLTPY